MKIYTTLEKKQISRDELIASERLKKKWERILNVDIPRAGEKILLAGPEGTGKTLAVSILASEQTQPVFMFSMNKYMTQDWEDSSDTVSTLETVINALGGVWYFPLPSESEVKTLTDKEKKKYYQRSEILLRTIQHLRYSGLIIIELSSSMNIPASLLEIVDDYLIFSMPDTLQVSALLNRQLPGMSDVSPEELEKLTACSHAEIVSICNDAKKSIEAGEPLEKVFGKAIDEFWFQKNIQRVSDDIKKMFAFW